MKLSVTCTILTILCSPQLLAQQTKSTRSVAITSSAYGELGFKHMNYGANQNRPNGSRADQRLEFDTTRLVGELEFELEDSWKVELEVEFEHGGTGSSLELEYEEFGEYEQEVEKGGAVYLEKFLIEKKFAEQFHVKVGRFPVKVGLLTDFHRPSQFLAAQRSEAETSVLPSLWHEMGVEVGWRHTWLSAHLQVVNGLDSTGFSSQYWVREGHQKKFEKVRATDPAIVLRLDFKPLQNLMVGASGYFGHSSRNRPKEDLAKSCADSSEKSVAPCGYEQGVVKIYDLHYRYDSNLIRTQGLVLVGDLSESQLISEKNSRLSNKLGVLRSPVAQQAYASWIELGINVLPFLGGQNQDTSLVPFVLWESYDTMYRVDAGMVDDPRFARKVTRFGLFYQPNPTIVLKIDAGTRSFGANQYRSENEIRLTTGFTF